MNTNVYAMVGVLHRIQESRPMNRLAGFEYYIKGVSDFYNIPDDKLKGKHRLLSLVKARHMVWLIVQENTTLSLNEIGIYFNSDHSTVLRGIKSLKGYIETDEKVKKEYEFLKIML